MTLTDGTARDEMSLAGEAAIGGATAAILLPQIPNATAGYLAVAAISAPGVWYCLTRSGFWVTLAMASVMFTAVGLTAAAVSV